MDFSITEGIKYAGSKLRLLPYIFQMLNEIQPSSVLDGFSGTTRVSQAFAAKGFRVVSNDLAIWSETFAMTYLLNTYPREHYQPLIEHLNDLPGHDGWFTENYGGEMKDGYSVGNDGLKKPWQLHNTRKLDAVREEIDRLSISDVERAVLITSLILALDQVDNTLGHFASYLNQWSRRSCEPFRMRLPRLITRDQNHSVHRSDIFELLPQVTTDLAYFDPPYGSNNEKMPPSRVRYAAYYHLWTTVCLNDKPNLFGRAKRRKDTSDRIAHSPFEDFRNAASGRFVAVEAIDRMLRAVRAEYVMLSYSSGGRATASELSEVMDSVGKVVSFMEIDYRRNVMASMRWTHKWVSEAAKPNREFLFLIQKS